MELLKSFFELCLVELLEKFVVFCIPGGNLGETPGSISEGFFGETPGEYLGRMTGGVLGRIPSKIYEGIHG